MIFTITLTLLFTAQLDAARPEISAWSAEGVAIRLVEKSEDALVNYVFEVRVEGKAPVFKKMRAKNLKLEDAWLGPAGNLIVRGRASSQATHLMIEARGEAENLWLRAWRNEVSPSGKFLALERLHAAHGGDGPDLVTIYDLTHTLATNLRYGGMTPETAGPVDCVGRVVYPEKASFNCICEPGPNDVMRMLVSPFLWRQKGDAEELFFLALETNTLFLIRTSLPAPANPVVIWRQEVDLRGRYQPKPNEDFQFKPGVKVWADKLSWTEAGKIRVELDPGYGFGPSFELEPD